MTCNIWLSLEPEDNVGVGGGDDGDDGDAERHERPVWAKSVQRVELTEWESCKKVDDEGSRGEEGGSHRRGREEGEPRGSNGQRRLSCRCNPPVSVSEMNWRWSESGFTETTVQHVSQRRKKNN